MGFFSDIDQNDLGEIGTEKPIIPSPVIEDDGDILTESGLLTDMEDKEFGNLLETEERGPEPAKKRKTEPTAPALTDACSIPKGAEVNGDVKYPGAVMISGKVMGIIDCDSLTVQESGAAHEINASDSVTIYGCNDGNIKCKNFIAEKKAKINGQIEASDSIMIGKDVVMVGDIIHSPGTISIYGAVKGNIKSEDTIIVKSSAIIKGSITAKDISIEKGSRIQGSIERTGDEIDDSIFA